ncbi:MAG: FAD-dependent oxidoreductase, partial [Desulfuromusa sp.]|nr:FAD-dependent oxidoreductase [Desulfuromusa sp.]
MDKITVIGAGLAGCEAAWQIAREGFQVKLYEMKPLQFSPAHQSEKLAELVCSNSLRGAGMNNAVGCLKEELRRSGSLFIEAA